MVQCSTSGSTILSGTQLRLAIGRDVIQAILLSKRRTNGCKSRSTILEAREICNRKAEMENETVDKTNLTAQEEVHMHGATTVSSV
jgi:hypothetical protein